MFLIREWKNLSATKKIGVNMKLELIRTNYGATATQGHMDVDGTRLFTIEQPWNNNHQDSSCVPDGEYSLVPFLSPKHFTTWVLLNQQLGIFGYSDVIVEGGRTYCELHAANFSSQVKGCIAFGLDDKPMIDPATGDMELAIERSKAAMKKIFSFLVPNTFGHVLSIYPAPGLAGTAGYIFKGVQE